MHTHSIPHSHFSFPHAAGGILVFSFTIFVVFLHPSMAEHSFLYCSMNVQQRSTNWRFEEVVFAPVKPIDIYEIEFAIRGLFSLLPFSFLVPRTFFFMPNNCILLLCASLFWFEGFRNGRGT